MQASSGLEKIYFATDHQKERAAGSLFLPLGLVVEPLSIQSDQFGTFSGEIARPGGVRETLRLKIKEAQKQKPEGKYFLASEGSFGPHPIWGIGQTGFEVVLFYDVQNQLEVTGENLDTSPTWMEWDIKGPEEFASIKESVRRFVEIEQTALLIFPKNKPSSALKALGSIAEIEKAILDMAVKESGPFHLQTELRAHLNPRRMHSVQQALQNLKEKLESTCPRCQTWGFWVSKTHPGLQCEDCGSPTSEILNRTWECQTCHHQEIRPGEKSAADPSNCEHCNP